MHFRRGQRALHTYAAKRRQSSRITPNVLLRLQVGTQRSTYPNRAVRGASKLSSGRIQIGDVLSDGLNTAPVMEKSKTGAACIPMTSMPIALGYGRSAALQEKSSEGVPAMWVMLFGSWALF